MAVAAGGGGGRSPLIIDEDALQAVAETTGGQYYRAESADQLQEALGDLPSQVTVVTKHVDIASWFAGAGGLLVVGRRRAVAVVEPGPHAAFATAKPGNRRHTTRPGREGVVCRQFLSRDASPRYDRG